MAEANPKQKSIDIPAINRYVPAWITPQWMVAERWRRVVDNQPIAAICEEAIIADLQDTPFEVRAKDPKEEDKLSDDINHYTNILNVDFFGAISGFDTVLVGLGVQDMLRIPMGGNFEVIRYPDKQGGLKEQNPKGHVHQLVYIDGSTLSPTFDKQFPVMQQIPEDSSRRVFFKRDEIMRLVQKPRVEMKAWGYQLAPPEKIYLAILSLYRGDAYYANLLLDTPEAGLLDLGDMSKQSAEDWLSSFRELMTGIDPFKIPVLYEHTTAAKYINFGRPPTEMMFADVTLKYSQITHAGYGLTLTDTGMGDPQKTLAGSVRDERRSRRSGFGRAREAIKTTLNKDVMPDYLEFNWIENDPESQTQRARAFLVTAQAIKWAKDAGFVTAAEGQAELIKSGVLTVEVEQPKEQEPPPTPPIPSGSQNGNRATQQVSDKKPVSEGGRGDVTGKAELGSEKITAVPKDSDHFDQLATVFRQAFDGMVSRMEPPQIMKLVKVATRKMFPDVTQAFLSIEDTDIDQWQAERLKAWFGEESEFDNYPDVQKANDVVLSDLEKTLNGDEWWKLDPAVAASAVVIFQMAFSEGASVAAQQVQEFLYTEGLRDQPAIIGLSFDLKNKRTLKMLEKAASQLVTRVNDGTKFYLKRIITAGVDEGLSSPAIAKMIREGADVEDILKEAGYTGRVIDTVKSEVGAMTRNRTNSIVNTEINRAESEGRRLQWRSMGLTKKQWVHTGPDVPCRFCQANQARGFIDIDMPFEGVFGEIQGPPAHPQVDHCHLGFDEKELIAKADTLKIWTGE